MEKELKKIHDHYRENYFDKVIDDQIKDKVQQGIHHIDMVAPEKKRRYSIRKRLMFIAMACLLLSGLFIGSAFMSPAIAEVASKIPFLNLIFDQKPISEIIMEELEEQGYEIAGSGYSVRDKLYYVTIRGSEEYYKQVKGEIEQITRELITARGYDDFKVEVEKERLVDPIVMEYDENDRISEQVNKITFEDIVPKLIQQGYEIQTKYVEVDGSFPANPEVITLNLTIADTETRKGEIEAAILEEVKRQGIQSEIKVKFRSINVQQKETEMQWSAEVLPVIFEGMLNKKEFKTKGVGYSFKKGTMNIYITTKVQKSDKEAPVLSKKIETAIEDFLQSEDLRDLVGDTPYKIVVRDKHSEEIK